MKQQMNYVDTDKFFYCDLYFTINQFSYRNYFRYIVSYETMEIVLCILFENESKEKINKLNVYYDSNLCMQILCVIYYKYLIKNIKCKYI